MVLPRVRHTLHLLAVRVVVPLQPLCHDLRPQAHFLHVEYEAHMIVLLLLPTARFVFDRLIRYLALTNQLSL